MSKKKYAYLGPAGSFTEAALAVFTNGDDAAEYVPVPDVITALTQLRQGLVDYAVVAIESTVAGGVTATLDTLAAGSPLYIVAETTLPIHFELVVRATGPTSLAEVQAVGAHTHGLAQCRNWLNQHVNQARQVGTDSNSAAAQALAASANTEFDAALAPPGLADRLGLRVLARNVADNPLAATRFVCVARPGPVPPPTGADKTTLVVHLPTDRAGALLQMLEHFSTRGVNLARIESRPRSDRPGEYAFSMDALAHISEQRLRETLVALKRTCPVVLYFGSYPAANLPPTQLSPGTSDAEFMAAQSWMEGLAKGIHG